MFISAALSTDIRKAKKEIDDLLMEAINMVFLQNNYSFIPGWDYHLHEFCHTDYFSLIFLKIEKNREKFPHIKDAELAQRRRIVDEMKTIIKGEDKISPSKPTCCAYRQLYLE